MQDQWPDVAIVWNRTAGGLLDGESERPPARREIERKPVFTRPEHDLAASGAILQQDMKLAGSGHGAWPGLDDGGEGGRATPGRDREKFRFGAAQPEPAGFD